MITPTIHHTGHRCPCCNSQERYEPGGLTVNRATGAVHYTATRVIDHTDGCPIPEDDQ